MSTGEKLTSLMREKGMGKRALAMKSGVSLATIRRMCSGDMRGSIYSWHRVLSVLGGDANEILRGDNDGERDGGERKPGGVPGDTGR